MARMKLSAGRLFAIPFGDGHHAVGQIVQEKPLLYVGVWGKDFPQVPTAEALDGAGDVFLAGYVSDAGFAGKRWPLIGDAAVDASIPRPCYVIAGPDGQVLKRFDGTVVKPADQAALDFYGRKTISNAAVFEGALNHFLLGGVNDWNYQKLLASHVAARVG